MGFFARFSLAVRRRETPFYDAIYRFAKRLFSVSMPCIPGFHRFLYYVPEEMRSVAGEENYAHWIAEQEAYMQKYPDSKRAHYDS